MQADPRGVTDEANRLYWQSDTSVADIAAKLDLSRRALYDAVVPLPTDTACTRCGAPLTYANRSARDNREARCTTCPTLDAEEAATRAAAGRTAAAGSGDGGAPDAARSDAATQPTDDDEAFDGFEADAPLDGGAFEGVELRRRALRLTTAALVGAAVGAAAAYALSRDA